MPKFNIQTQAIPTVASAYADIIGTTDSQIVEIRNELIIEDNNQHFQIHEDTIEQLAEHIAKDGQLSPCIVAPLSDGKYELIDGRHRRRAVIKAGLPTTKCIIKTGLSDQAKRTIRLTSNLIRNNDYLPSELAFAYKELAALEDMKTISEETNLSKKKIYRYIRLTFLIQPLLNRVDSGAIPIIAAVELSYLSKEEQSEVFTFLLNHSDCKITTAIAKDIKENPCDLYSIFYGNNEEMDNLSTDEPAEISDEAAEKDPIETLVDKALEPYQHSHEGHTDTSSEAEADTNADQSDDPEKVQEKVDKLSTETNTLSSSGDNPTIKSSLFVNKDALLYLDSEGNAHTVEEINDRILKILCEYVIETTNIDYYIFRLAYDAKEILAEWNKKHIKVSHGQTVCETSATTGKRRVAGYAKWNAANRMFDIEIKGDHYIFLHKVLEQVVRRYIRKTYTLEKIQEVIRSKNESHINKSTYHRR